MFNTPSTPDRTPDADPRGPRDDHRYLNGEGHPATPLQKPVILLALTFGAVCLFAILAGILSYGIMQASGFDGSWYLSDLLDNGRKNGLRIASFVAAVVQFAVPAALVLILAFRGRWWQAAGLSTWPSVRTFFLPAAVAVAALPAVAWLVWANLQLPLPAWATNNEAQVDALMFAMLVTDDYAALALNVLTIGVVAAVGEELLMRGLIQRRILRPWTGNPHAAIWLAAFLFSFMHFEFAGFFPRFVLGALLGYAYLWSNSLWVPILLHFLFNATQVVQVFITGELVTTPTRADTPHELFALGSLLLAFFLGRWVHRRLAPPTNQPTVSL